MEKENSEKQLSQNVEAVCPGSSWLRKKKSPAFSKTQFIDMSEQNRLKYNPINSEWQVCYCVA